MTQLGIVKRNIVRADRFVHYPIGQPVRFDLNPAMVRFFDPKTQQAILTV